MGRKRIKLSDQVRRAIKESGMTRYAICQETGIDQGAMSHFLAGHRGLSMDSLDRLADLLKLNIAKGGRGKSR